jgi:hypothetical protein
MIAGKFKTPNPDSSNSATALRNHQRDFSHKKRFTEINGNIIVGANKPFVKNKTKTERTSKSIFQTFALFPNLEAKRITAKEQANQGRLEQRPDRQTSFRCRREEKRTSSSRSSEPHGASKLTLHRAALSSPHPAMTVVSPISSLHEKEKEEAAGQKQRRHLGSAVSLYRPSSCCLLGP